MAEEYALIASRRHDGILAKEDIWKQIELNYYGGVDYRDASPNYLFQHPKESGASFTKRKARAVLFNQLAPIVDLLVGFIYANIPQRTKTEKVQYFVENASKGNDINMFMRALAKWSLMFTTGVLIDSPAFDPEIVKTEQDRVDNKLTPFAVMYKPDRIRDFAIDDHGDLIWILLDNSYVDKNDPMTEDEEIEIYRLWERDKFTDFKVNGNETEIISENTHPIGYVPFHFTNWRDDNKDFITESICEDLALINQAIYNFTSYMDEMVAAGTFKMLFYPTKDGETPAELKAGVGPLSLMPFDASQPHKPYFDGAKLEEITSFIGAMDFYMSELLKKIGMDNDEEKAFVKSGAARKMDFEKVKTLLNAGSIAMQTTEIWMFETAQKWMKSSSDVEINYSTDFLSEDIDERLARFAQVLFSPSEKARKLANILILKTALANDVEQKEMDEAIKEIQDAEALEPLDTEDLTNQENGERNNETSNDD